MRPHITMSLLAATALITGCGATSEPPDHAAGSAGADHLALAAQPDTRSAADVLGPVGWRGLNLSMTQARAITTGMLGRRTGAPTPCQQWSPQPKTISSVFVSQRLGVAAIVAAPGTAVQTPEGMTIGWTLDQVIQAYSGVPSAVQDSNVRFVPVPHNSRARYRVGFDLGGRVSTLALELTAEDCYD